MAETAERVIAIGRGRLIVAVAELRRMVATRRRVMVRTPDQDRLSELLTGLGAGFTHQRERGVLEIEALAAEEVGNAAAEAGIAIHELTSGEASLEGAFLELTRDAVDFRSSTESPGAA